MSTVKATITMSLDGYVAGPDQSEQTPLGVGGEELHSWLVELEVFSAAHGVGGHAVNASTPIAEEILGGVGATIMGRNMFGGGPGPWGDDPWRGFWGDEPPYHHPVFVLTHHPREPLELEGTTFHFVTDGIHSALEQARAAADGARVSIGGGATAVQQYLAAGLIDELVVSVVPLFLGGGARLFDGLGGAPALRQVEAVEAPGVTHIRYARDAG